LIARAGFQAPPDVKRIERQDAARHLQEPLAKSLGDVGLAPAFLAENSDVGAKRGIWDGIGFQYPTSLSSGAISTAESVG